MIPADLKDETPAPATTDHGPSVTPHSELLEAIRRVANGGQYITAKVAEPLADEVSLDTTQPPQTLLSDREFEVMRKIGCGRTVTDMAETLSLRVERRAAVEQVDTGSPIALPGRLYGSKGSTAFVPRRAVSYHEVPC